MLSIEDIKFLRDCSDTERIEGIIEKCSKTPEVIITLKDGCYVHSISSAPVVIIIEDLDSIEQGGELYITEASYVTKEAYDKALKQAHRNVTIQYIANSDKSVTEARIFIHNEEDCFPYNVMISQEVVATFKTFSEAAQFLAEIGEALK